MHLHIPIHLEQGKTIWSSQGQLESIQLKPAKFTNNKI